MNDDLPDDSPPPCCPSCGVAYRDHLGLHGTCAEVQQLRAALIISQRVYAAAHARAETLALDAQQLRAALAELQQHVGSIHKATARGMEHERAAVVAWLLSDGPDGPAGLWARAAGGSELTIAAAGIERGAHHEEVRR